MVLYEFIVKVNQKFPNDLNIAIETKSYPNHFNDLIAENAKLMDSPIHLLMSHHKNQRILKQKKHLRDHFDGQADNISDALIENSDEKDIKPNNDLVQSNETLTSDNPSIKSNQNIIKKNRTCIKKRLCVILIASLVSLSSIYLLEIISCIIRSSNLNLIIYKLSTCIGSFGLVIIMGYQCGNIMKRNVASHLKNIRSSNEDFYTIFSFNSEEKDKMEKIKFQIIQKSRSNLDDLEEGETQLINSSLLNKYGVEFNTEIAERKIPRPLRWNFYSMLLSILLINFWILSTYLVGYLFSSSSYFSENDSDLKTSSILEMLSAVVGGFGSALLLKNIIIALCEIDINVHKENLLEEKFSSYVQSNQIKSNDNLINTKNSDRKNNLKSKIY